MNNEPIEFEINGKKHKVKRLNNWVALKMSQYVVEAELERSNNQDIKITSLVKNRLLTPKCISLIILRSTLKVSLFHWLYWRYLHYFKTQEDYTHILDAVLNSEESIFFFRNLGSLQQSNVLETEMTQENTKSIALKHQSAQ